MTSLVKLQRTSEKKNVESKNDDVEDDFQPELARAWSRRLPLRSQPTSLPSWFGRQETIPSEMKVALPHTYTAYVTTLLSLLTLVPLLTLLINTVAYICLDCYMVRAYHMMGFRRFMGIERS